MSRRADEFAGKRAVGDVSAAHYRLAPLILEGRRRASSRPCARDRFYSVKRTSPLRRRVRSWLGGSARNDMGAIPTVVGEAPQCCEVDAYFHRLSEHQSGRALSATVLRSFFVDVVRQPVEAFVNPSLPFSADRRTSRPYDQILLVAHSMVLSFVEGPCSTCTRACDGLLGRFRLLFYAPAHAGADVALLIGSGFGLDALPGAKLVGAAALVLMRSPARSATRQRHVEGLARETKEALDSRGQSAGYLRAKVFHAEDDHVVRRHIFVGMEIGTRVVGKNHRTICKQTVTTAIQLSTSTHS